MGGSEYRTTVQALKVKQWLSNWDEIIWQEQENRSEPMHWFYQFSLAATELRKLSGTYARKTTGRIRGADDLGIQRGLNRDRSNEIKSFVEYGYPWSTLSNSMREMDEYKDLRQPGWLPTAIIVNILKSNDKRGGKLVDQTDLIEVTDIDDNTAELLLPLGTTNWSPKSIPPIEVIDGQHRLWAFDDSLPEGNYELPVVAFVGLDLSWQAYLFYMINIKPKKINASLAFDLYPLLRAEQWLTKFSGPAIYRETRAQELVDLLWSHPESPWNKRINMLGEAGQRGFTVTQSSWVRTLMASFIKRWQVHGESIGGLFGSAVGEHKSVLPWTRTEQAAFLILVGQTFQKSISKMSEPWMKSLRESGESGLLPAEKDPAFFGANNLINSDQGNRVIFQIVNDFFVIQADELELYQWGGDQFDADSDFERIDINLKSLKKERKILDYLKELSDVLALYDWRASSGPGLKEDERIRKAAFRGAGGYKELRRDVLRHINCNKETLADVASDIIARLGY